MAAPLGDGWGGALAVLIRDALAEDPRRLGLSPHVPRVGFSLEEPGDYIVRAAGGDPEEADDGTSATEGLAGQTTAIVREAVDVAVCVGRGNEVATLSLWPSVRKCMRAALLAGWQEPDASFREVQYAEASEEAPIAEAGFVFSARYSVTLDLTRD